MQIYVAKNGQRLGPFTLDEVRSKLACGEWIGSDLAWREGLVNWLPLQQVAAWYPAGPGVLPPLLAKRSGLATASFVIAMADIGAWLLIIFVVAASAGSGPREDNPVMMLVGLIALTGIAANVVGTILGIIALTKPLSNKWMAVVGLVVNAVEFFGVILLMLIGLAVQNL